MKTYLVAWTGGLEEPAYFATAVLDEAQAKFTEWTNDSTETGDRIQLLAVADGQMEILQDSDVEEEDR